MKTALLALAVALPLAAEPLRYSGEVGDAYLMEGSFRSETIVRRGTSVQKLAWVRSGSQRVLVLSREGARMFYAVEADHGPAQPVAWVVDGQDRLRAEAEAVREGLPGTERRVTFLTLDDRGAGAPAPLDAELPEALLRALDEIEVLPEKDEAGWTRRGEVGPIAWEGTFTRTGASVAATFEFRLREDRGARVLFDTGRASIEIAAGRASKISGSASWTVGGADGSERRQLEFTLAARGGKRLPAAELADAASDAASLAAAEEAWRTGERDRAVEGWEKAGGDAGNRWAERARERAAGARQEWPMLGRSPGAWGAKSWIGAAPEAGRWTLVYFWATWAKRCDGELAGLAALVRGRGGVSAAAVTMVDALQSEEQVRGFLAGRELPFGVGLDDGGALRAFKVEDLPRVYLVDPEGKVRFEGRGNEVETLRALLDRFVPE